MSSSKQRSAVTKDAAAPQQMRGRLEMIEGELRALEQEETEVEVEACELEREICQLAKEEADLQRRKRAMQARAAGIGDQRTELLARRKRIAKERSRVESQLELDLRAQEQARERLDLQRAYEEALRPAVVRYVPSGAERRTAPRASVAVDVSMHTEHNFYMGLTENLSEGGLFIATWDDLPVGTELDLELNLPACPTIRSRVKVRWLREYTPYTEDMAAGVGVQFLALSESDRAAIRQFIVERDPVLYDVA
ncbi:MAG: PilZ domain-containing protein [Deltaproteobacteria bacterium]|nr:PilZ domain-containing protein [Deltaproteobacteria bacterium]